MARKEKCPPYPKRKVCDCTDCEPEWSWQGGDDIWLCLGCYMRLDRLGRPITDKKSKKQAGPARKLELKDFQNALFKTRVTQRWVKLEAVEGEICATTERKQKAFEGTTYTDQYIFVGFTYLCEDEILSVVNQKNQQLFLGKIKTADDFEKALKKADEKEKSLR